MIVAAGIAIGIGIETTCNLVGWVERSETHHGSETHRQRINLPNMTAYRRCRLPGRTFFFTVNLADRRKALLTEHIDSLRGAFREVLSAHPFEIRRIGIPLIGEENDDRFRL